MGKSIAQKFTNFPSPCVRVQYLKEAWVLHGIVFVCGRVGGGARCANDACKLLALLLPLCHLIGAVRLPELRVTVHICSPIKVSLFPDMTAVYGNESIITSVESRTALHIRTYVRSLH